LVRVVVFVPDLLFGSNVVGAVSAGGHEPVLVGDADGVRRELPGADALIVDLTVDAQSRMAALGAPGVPVLAFYSHVETDVRTLALDARFDLVVPRSRMAREGAALVQRLLAQP
jgi:hypothetical protein